MTTATDTPQETAEPLTGQMAFRSTEEDKALLRLIAVWNEETESEVIRRHFNFEAFRAEAERIRALREESKVA